MMKLLFSTMDSGTKGLQKNWCYGFLVLLIMLNNQKVTAKEFKCHFDICDDDSQYCDESEGELRCKYCVCDPGPVIPKCQEICANKVVTTQMVTTVLPVLTENTHTNALIGIASIILVFVITGIVIVCYLYATKKYCFAEPQTPTSSARSSKDTLIIINNDSFGSEKDNSPIFKKKKLPIEEQGNKRSDGSGQIHTRPTLDEDSERHRLMMDNPNDIAIHENKSQLDEETLPKHTLF